jgi:hypothetical protein
MYWCLCATACITELHQLSCDFLALIAALMRMRHLTDPGMSRSMSEMVSDNPVPELCIVPIQVEVHMTWWVLVLYHFIVAASRFSSTTQHASDEANTAYSLIPWPSHSPCPWQHKACCIVVLWWTDLVGWHCLFVGIPLHGHVWPLLHTRYVLVSACFLSAACCIIAHVALGGCHFASAKNA